MLSVGQTLKWTKHQKGVTDTGRKGVRAQLSETMPRETTLYLWLCSSTQLRRKSVNVLCKEREEVSPLLPSDTGRMENADMMGK